ncbi:MAG TPA: gamma-glutamyltransferase, partial [Falsiroseomonas sp.]|nr:gamma-glutamyltransferase [Falsiroseomonas sp.]
MCRSPAFSTLATALHAARKSIPPGRFLLPFGTPGGDVQSQAMLQTLLNVLLFGMDPQDAVEHPRIA